MSHGVYTTDAFVLGSMSNGESSKLLALFTREFGLLRAHARAVREGKSKLRYHLQDFTEGKVALVRGADMWRVTGGESSDNLYRFFEEEPQKFESIARVFQFLKRLIVGEEKNEDLYDVVRGSIDFLKKENLSKEGVDAIELLLMFRILFILGYIKGSESNALMTAPFDRKILEHVQGERSRMIGEINQALKESHL